MRYVLPFFFILLFAGAAEAKKSNFKVHNCTDQNFKVEVYNGDDGSRSTPRKTEMVKPGQSESLGCRVSSGKKRCFYRIKNGSEDPSKAHRVGDGNTIYVTKLSFVGQPNNQGGWGNSAPSEGKTTFESNRKSCDD